MFDSPRILNTDEISSSIIKESEKETLPKDFLDSDLEQAKLEGYFVADSVQPTLKDWYENVLLINEEERVNKILLLDTETNDLNGFAVSIALIQLDLASKKIDRTYYKVINPKAYINPESIEIHGITPEMVENAPTFQDIFEEVDEFVRSSDLLCAFNAIYDVGVLVREYERVGKIPPPMPYLDAMKRLKVQVQAKNVAGKLKDPKLSEAADFFGIQYNEEDLHNALDDTKILTKVFIKALQSYE